MRKPISNNTSARRKFIKLALAGMTATGAGAWLRFSPALAQTVVRDKVPQQAVDTLLAGWPEKQQEVAKKIIDKYGLPNGGTTTNLVIWLDNGPWKYTILYREEVPHNFPMKHVDILEQAINYRVPSGKINELAVYNGSLTVRRTKGDIVAMCDKEEMNFLALNLAHDIVTEKLSAAAARQAYTTTAVAFLKGEKPPYTQGLQFQAPQSDTGDPDQLQVAM
jgi:hypothetical protein